ncbi:ion channel [Advenella sp. RU8]|uniref:ion channel n=1 Tax=Advenella sp. RU8 TaxID=3399575 RepID=UPI003AAFC70E
MINGLWLTLPVLYKYSHHFGKDTGEFVHWMQTLGFFHLLELPRFALGTCLVLFSIFMFTGARLACFFSIFALFLLLVLDITLGSAYFIHGIYSFVLLVLLLHYWKRFPNYSISNTAGLALLSIAILIVYSVLGSLYLGSHFNPKISDIFQAFYFSVVSMTTVGYGDIVPVTIESRLFTISVVFLGITIFTTSVVYLAGIAATDTRKIVNKRLLKMKDHYVIVGVSQVAVFVYKGLKKRGLQTVIVCDEKHRDLFPADALVVSGEVTDIATLDKASVKDARCVMALEQSDVENTYILLAVKKMASDKVKTITMINEEGNRNKLQLLHVDYIFSLPEVGSEVLMKYLSGEAIDNNTIADLVIHHS